MTAAIVDGAATSANVFFTANVAAAGAVGGGLLFQAATGGFGGANAGKLAGIPKADDVGHVARLASRADGAATALVPDSKAVLGAGSPLVIAPLRSFEKPLHTLTTWGGRLA